MWKCVNCSAINESDANFCAMCGTPRPKAAPGQERAKREPERTEEYGQPYMPPERQTPRHKRRWLVPVAIVLAVALIAGLGVVFMELKYRKADEYARQELWEQAYQAFDSIGWYRDSDRRAQEAAALAMGAPEDTNTETQTGGAEANEGMEDAEEMTLAVPDFGAQQSAEPTAPAESAAPEATEPAGTVAPEATEPNVSVAPEPTGEAAEYAAGTALTSEDTQVETASPTLNLEITDRRIAAGSYHTVGLKQDGTVTVAGENSHGQCGVDAWFNIVAVSAGNLHTVGLTAGGTVLAVGDNAYGQCDVSEWSDIDAISAGGYYTLGVKSDGTVVAAGLNVYGQCDVNTWSGIESVSAGYWHTVGLRADGSVTAAGYNEWGQCDVGDWSNIVQVAAGRSHTVALRADGTVTAEGDNEYGQCDVSGWTDIVSVKAGVAYTVGLKSDGTLVTAGYHGDDGRCDVGAWSGISAIAVGGYHTLGVGGDGSVVATGWNKSGACDVSAWRLGAAE